MKNNLIRLIFAFTCLISSAMYTNAEPQDQKKPVGLEQVEINKLKTQFDNIIKTFGLANGRLPTESELINQIKRKSNISEHADIISFKSLKKWQSELKFKTKKGGFTVKHKTRIRIFGDKSKDVEKIRRAALKNPALLSTAYNNVIHHFVVFDKITIYLPTSNTNFIAGAQKKYSHKNAKGLQLNLNKKSIKIHKLSGGFHAKSPFECLVDGSRTIPFDLLSSPYKYEKIPILDSGALDLDRFSPIHPSGKYEEIKSRIGFSKEINFKLFRLPIGDHLARYENNRLTHLQKLKKNMDKALFESFPTLPVIELLNNKNYPPLRLAVCNFKGIQRARAEVLRTQGFRTIAGYEARKLFHPTELNPSTELILERGLFCKLINQNNFPIPIPPKLKASKLKANSCDLNESKANKILAIPDADKKISRIKLSFFSKLK